VPPTPILTVPLCFPPERPPAPGVAVTAAGQLLPRAATTTTATAVAASGPPIALLRPPLVKIDPAAAAAVAGPRGAPTVAGGAAAFPAVTILHPAFRQLSPLLCSPLLMAAPFAAVPSTTSA